MIRFLTGIPRSGKTYHAVHEILETLKKTDKDGNLESTHILSNIEGLSVDDARLTVMEFDNQFFQAQRIIPFLRNLRDQNGLSDKDTIHIYIDEAQRYFNKPDPDTVYFFDTHGHHGVDVCIITQHEKKISSQISCHAEFEIRAAAGSTNPFRSFVYKQLQAGEQFGTKRLKREKRVFDAYKSFQAGTGQAPKSRLRFWVFALVVGAVLFWLIFFRVFAASFGLTGDKDENPPASTPPAGVYLKDPPSKVLPQKNGLQPYNQKEEKRESLYMGPQVIAYDQASDSVILDDPALTLPVKKFLVEYPPDLYGYGYFHVSKKRFVMMSASNQDLIFPVQNPVYVRQFIESEPVQVVQLQVHEPYAEPTMPVNGFTAMDRRVARWADLTLKGYEVSRPWIKENVPGQQIPEGNQTVTAQKKAP